MSVAIGAHWNLLDSSALSDSLKWTGNIIFKTHQRTTRTDSLFKVYGSVQSISADNKKIQFYLNDDLIVLEGKLANGSLKETWTRLASPPVTLDQFRRKVFALNAAPGKNFEREEWTNPHDKDFVTELASMKLVN
jgi:hypothetical protein